MSSVIRFLALNQTEYANGWDGYYYIMQVFTLLERGEMRALDFSLIYPAFTLISFFLEDYILGFKTGASILAGLFTLVSFNFINKLLKDKFSATLVAAFTIFSPTLTFVSSQFSKNLLGAIFLILFLTCLIENNNFKKGIYFILTFITHRMTAGLASIILFLDIFSFRKIKIILVIGSIAILSSLVLPGIIHVSDFQRLSGSFSMIPNLAPWSFVKIWSYSKISILWYIEIIMLCAAFIAFLIFIINKYFLRNEFNKLYFYLLLILCILIFPFFSFKNANIAYRFYLIFNLIAISVCGILLKSLSKRIKISLSMLLIVLSCFSFKAYNPRIFDPPYRQYFDMLSPLEDIAHKNEAQLIIAHQGLAQIIIIYTNIDATNWQPKPDIDQKKIWRVTANLNHSDFVSYLNNEDLNYLKVLSKNYKYYFIREDKWDKFYSRAKQVQNTELLNRIGYWCNPMIQKPGYLTKGRNIMRHDESAEVESGKANNDTLSKILRIATAYPDFFDTRQDQDFLLWKDGTKMIFDDGIKAKDFSTLLNSPDLEDQLLMLYPAGSNYSTPEINRDPGRIRYDPFFRKMYGASPEAVRKNLITIKWLASSTNKKLLVTTINGVNKKLAAISNELDTLPPELKKFVLNPGGTYNWRTISGTKRLSTHSFGIAVDINVTYSNYWRWDMSDPEQKVHYRNRIPLKIVEIFEKHGFIWGGKWYHYDTMHFEYRPELLVN